MPVAESPTGNRDADLLLGFRDEDGQVSADFRRRDFARR